MKKYLIYIFLSFVAVNSFAQTTSIKVLNSENEALAYADVLLCDSLYLIQGKIVADSNGIFEIMNVEKSIEHVIIMYLGYKNDTLGFEKLMNGFGSVKLERLENNLNEFVVKAKKEEFSFKGDKLVFNVENSKAVSNSDLDVLLQIVPGISFDVNNNINFRGRAGVEIRIDGKVLRMPAELVRDYLKSIPSNNIEKIELTSSPRANYDASGTAGIIEIKLKRPANLGFNSSITANYSRANYDRGSLNVLFNNRFSSKLNIFGSYTIRKGKNLIISNSDRTVDLLGFFDQVGNTNLDYFSHNARLGFDLELGKHSFEGGINYVQSKTNDATVSNTTTGQFKIDSTVNFESLNNRLLKNASFTLMHTLKLDSVGGFIKTTFDYYPSNFKSNTNQTTNVFNENTSELLYTFLEKFQSPSLVNINSISIDGFKKYNTVEVDAGLKYAVTNTDNELEFQKIENNLWVVDKQKSDYFLYNEKIWAAYSGINYKSPKYELYGGLRYEGSIANGNSIALDSNFILKINKLFPSISFTRLFEGSSINITYSKRIDRPIYSQLNPFVYFIDKFSFWKGNVYLQPMISHTVTLSHNVSQAFNYSLNFTRSLKAFNQLPIQDDITGKIFNSTYNIGDVTYLGGNISFNKEIVKNFYNYTNVGIYYNESSDTRFPNIESVRGVQYFINSYNSISLKNNYSIEISGQYFSPAASFWVTKPFAVLNMGMAKVFNNGFKLAVNFSDIFDSTVYNNTSNHLNLNIKSYYKPETRIFSLSLTKTFGNLKSKVSKERKSGIEDEKERVKYN